MNAYTIAESLVRTAREGGGGTVDLNGAQSDRTTGYYVGGKSESLVFKSIDEVDRGEVGLFVGTNGPSWFGSWVDQEDGKVYFDAVDWIADGPAALNLAFSRKEIAVWDIANSEEIRVKDAQGVGDDN